MDSSYKKIDCFDEVDVKLLLEGFYSPLVPCSVSQESTINMMEAFYKAISTGEVTGRSVINFCFAPIIVPLLVMKDSVEDIAVLLSNDASVKELEKWKNKDPNAFNWSLPIQILTKIKENSDDVCRDEEEDLRGKLKIYKWDFSKYNPADSSPLLKADIATSIWCLEMVSDDHEDYRRNLRKLSTIIKLGGHLFIYAVVNASFLKLGEDKFHFLCCDESFYRKVLSQEGFEVKHCQKFDRLIISDATDHEAQIFIIAQKVKEP